MRRPARALHRWSRTMSLAASPAPFVPSAPASTLLAWHVRALRSWDIPCDAPEALVSGRIESAGPAPGVDLLAMIKGSAQRVLFLGQAGQADGVVFGLFANCPLSGDARGRDPALKSAFLALEHPHGGAAEVAAARPELRRRGGRVIPEDRDGFLHDRAQG
jgi:hypothetical protein